jgi:hypothetical protein
METTINPSAARSYTDNAISHSPVQRFINWATLQQENRLLWLGVALSAHGCILTPITVMVVLLSGGGFALFMVAMCAMALTLVTNLAAMPTKVTIPAFFISVLIDVVLLLMCL